MQVDLDNGIVVSHTAYKSLIKASWILSDVITKHPQLNLLKAAIQYDVQALAEARIYHSNVILLLKLPHTCSFQYVILM